MAQLNKGSLKKKYKTLDMWQRGGGGSAAQETCNEEKFGHVIRGGGQRAPSKVVFVKKSLY